jgi:hypothetical protein
VRPATDEIWRAARAGEAIESTERSLSIARPSDGGVIREEEP